MLFDFGPLPDDVRFEDDDLLELVLFFAGICLLHQTIVIYIYSLETRLSELVSTKGWWNRAADL